MFSLLAAKNTACTVYNIDLNPVASQLCKENAQINNAQGRGHFIKWGCNSNY